jgi:hypothetical protein
VSGARADEGSARDGERASSAAKVEPPLSASAPNVSSSADGLCSRRTSSSATPTPTEAIVVLATPYAHSTTQPANQP